MKLRKRKTPYKDRPKTQQLEVNWKITLRLFDDAEYSVSIIRAATCVELATNIAVRAELITKRKLGMDFVDGLMRWANGLSGKLDKLLRPMYDEAKDAATFKKYRELAQKVNEARNEIAHSGCLSTKTHAREILELAHKFCTEITKAYPPAVSLPTVSKASIQILR